MSILIAKPWKKLLICAGAVLLVAFQFVLDAPISLPFVKGMPKGSWSLFFWTALPVFLTLAVMLADRKRIDRILRSVSEPWPHGGGETAPPRPAVYLLCLVLPKATRVNLVGDLEEEYEDNCNRFGPRRANFLVWAEVLRSLWPLLKRAGANLLRWGVMGWLLDLLHRFVR